ncbi:MAG: response regulator [Akkermansiaceae bacterium]
MNETSILIVDDGLVIRTVLSRKLQEKGYTVTAAVNGKNALEIIADGLQPDLIILDVHMPELNGLETLRELRKTHTATQLPVIMATTKDEDEDIVNCFDAGASDFVSKPINFPVLFARMNTHLKLKQLMSQAGL